MKFSKKLLEFGVSWYFFGLGVSALIANDAKLFWRRLVITTKKDSYICNCIDGKYEWRPTGTTDVKTVEYDWEVYDMSIPEQNELLKKAAKIASKIPKEGVKEVLKK